jgi:monoterpene epsilon-lactone hydrolase
MFAISLPEFIVATFLRLVVRPVLGPPFPVSVQRFWLAFTALLSQPPLGIRRRKISLGGVDSVSFAPRGVGATGAVESPVVLYLHGGAFVTGSSLTHAGLAGYLAKELGSVVHVVLYGLGPERPYPAGRKDALAAYQGLVELGVDPGRIILAGDSAGGAMVADLLFDCAEAGGPQPAGGVMYSPAVGLNSERPARAGRHDTLVRRGWISVSAQAYQRDATPLKDRIMGRDSALLASLPPIYLQYSDEELLAGECRAFVEELRAAGVQPQVYADRGAFHVLPLLPGIMGRAREAVANTVTFARAATARGAARDFAPGAGAGSLSGLTGERDAS